MWLPDDGFMWTETCWSSFYNFNYFNNLTILSFVCINWTIKCLILLMHGATMKFTVTTLTFSNATFLLTQPRRNVTWSTALHTSLWCYGKEKNTNQITNNMEQSSTLQEACLWCWRQSGYWRRQWSSVRKKHRIVIRRDHAYRKIKKNMKMRWLHRKKSLRLKTLRTGLLNCLNARSRGLTFRHRAYCI